MPEMGKTGGGGGEGENKKETNETPLSFGGGFLTHALIIIYRGIT